MFLKIVQYRFKDAESKQKGQEFIIDQMIPEEQNKFGFLGYALSDAPEQDLILLLKYKVRENMNPETLSKEAYAQFADLWEEVPMVMMGANKAYPEFQGVS